MFRRSRTGRDHRVAAVLRVLGGAALRRALLLAGVAIAAWLLGSAAASADVLGAADAAAASAPEASESSGSGRPAPVSAAPDADQAVSSGERTVERAVPAPEPEVDTAPAAVPAAPKPAVPSPGEVADIADTDAAVPAAEHVRDTAAAVGPATDTGRGGDAPADRGERSERPQVRPEAEDGSDHAHSRTAEKRVATDATALARSIDQAADHGTPGDGDRALRAGSDDRGHPAEHTPAPITVPGQSSAAGSPMTAMAGYLTRVPGLHRDGAGTQAERPASAPMPQAPADERSFSPD